MLLLLKGRLRTNLVFQPTFSLSIRKKCGQVAVAALQAEGISIEAWVPFGSRLERYFHNPVLSKLARNTANRV